jgi:hypothetical protein
MRASGYRVGTLKWILAAAQSLDPRGSRTAARAILVLMRQACSIDAEQADGHGGRAVRSTWGLQRLRSVAAVTAGGCAAAQPILITCTSRRVAGRCRRAAEKKRSVGAFLFQFDFFLIVQQLVGALFQRV